MPDSPSAPAILRATLVTDDEISMSGRLSLTADGRLTLGDLQRAGGAAAPIEVGVFATLSVHAQAGHPGAGHPGAGHPGAGHPDAGQNAPIEDARVRIAAVDRKELTMVLASGDTPAARHYRDRLARLAGGDDATGIAQAADAAQPQATADSAALLAEVRRRSIDQFARELHPFLNYLTDHLLELSSKLRQRKDGANQHYEAAIIVRHGRGDIARNVVDRLNAYYDDLTPTCGADQLWHYNIGGAEELDLVDLQEFEDFLLIDRMVSDGEALHRVQLEALTLRLAELVAVDPNTLRNPVHVRQLCRALQQALVDVNVPPPVLGHIFEYFGKHLLQQLDEYYRPLNQLLAEHQVRPGVEQEIAKSGSLLKPPDSPERQRPTRRRHREQDATSGAPAPGAGEAGGGPGAAGDVQRRATPRAAGATLGRFSPDNLYSSVVDALNFKREVEGLADGRTLDSGIALSGTWAGSTVASDDVDQDRLADARAIARVLGILQHDATARRAVAESESLRAYLAQHREEFDELQRSSGLTAESLNQLDMVDNLFGTIRSQLDLTSELRPALADLQVPLAKLALLDPRFFVEPGHAARSVVDKLSQLASTGNFPNKALESRINDIVADILANFDTDAAVFDRALATIDRLAAQQERALSRNIERVVRTQEGQHKLAEARRAVAAVIREAIPDDTAPDVLVKLIESGLRDTMVLTHVKEGPQSQAWEEQVRNLEVLCAWLSEQQTGDVDEDRNVQRSLEAEPLLELIGAQIATALPANISHESVLEELREILAGSAEVATVQVGDTLGGDEPDPDKQRERIEELPRLRRWVRRVEELKKDTWLTYRDKSGTKKRMQLAWISPSRDRYIFVNERGQKVADLSAIRLARQLSRGMQPPAPADRLSVVDQSMYQTLEHVQKTLSFARNHDSLTRLINRETFLDQMARALRHSQRKHSLHAVLYLNIDQFELVNEVYDRVSGDQVLLEFAKLLAQLHSKKSSSSRIRADEFGVLLIDRPMAAALEVAEKIRRDIEASSMEIDGQNVTFTVSIGVAEIAEHSAGVEEILDAARSAMQLAKQDGRNRVNQYQREQDEATRYRAQKRRLRQNLEEALATDRFALRAQPIVQTAVGDERRSREHFELLLGLKNSEGTLSSPQEFIQSAERYGFMTLVDRWVVREAFAWISSLIDRQKVVPNLAINLSGASVADDSFLDYLLEQISEFGVGTSRLCFEITETGTISNLVKAADFVRAFRNIGCKFSIDDFGTGLASHNYLRELPVDYVKIDGSFITGIHKNRNDYAMARSINDLAHFLGQETIAESVENAAIIAKLKEIGVDYLQGWGVGRPRLLGEVADELSNVEK